MRGRPQSPDMGAALIGGAEYLQKRPGECEGQKREHGENGPDAMCLRAPTRQTLSGASTSTTTVIP